MQVLGETSAARVTNLWHWKHVPSEPHKKNTACKLYDHTTYVHIKTIF
jgi:hypothetical protein